MCGIAGFVSPNRPLRLKNLMMLNQDIKHRGPDDEGFAVIFSDMSSLEPLIGPDSSIKDCKDVRDHKEYLVKSGISHRRFSIIDTSLAGHQPYFSDCNQFALSFNGEIYNYLELRDELTGLGYGPFKTQSDTEVLVWAYKAWGLECFQKFNGFWAIAILHGDKLVLSRDRVGKKPLYYSNDGAMLVFASEIKPILNFRRHNNLGNDLCMQAAYDYLLFDRRNTSKDSFFKNIKQVKPASSIEINLTNLRIIREHSFWSISEIRRDESMTEKYALDRFEAVLDDSVSLRLRCDVPLEVNLSGGLDSAAITSVASSMLKTKNKQLTAHNIRYVGDKALDETSNAALIARCCDVDFRTIVIPRENEHNQIENLISVSEEPVHSMGALFQNQAWHHIASEGFKVILHGSGNDEVMLGYDYLKKIELMNRLKSGQFQDLFRDILHQPIVFFKLIKWLIGERNDEVSSGSKYFSPEFLKKNQSRHFDYLTTLNHVNKKTSDRMLSDLKHLRIPYWCNLMDKNMMNVPVEVRMPFLDHKFLEYIFSVPEKYLLRNGYTKYLLRRALVDKLPQSIVWQKVKVGFSAPKTRWLIENKERLMADFEYPGLENFIDINRVRSDLIIMNPDLAWRCVNFAKWYRLLNAS